MLKTILLLSVALALVEAYPGTYFYCPPGYQSNNQGLCIHASMAGIKEEALMLARNADADPNVSKGLRYCRCGSSHGQCRPCYGGDW